MFIGKKRIRIVFCRPSAHPLPSISFSRARTAFAYYCGARNAPILYYSNRAGITRQDTLTLSVKLYHDKIGVYRPIRVHGQ